MSTPQTHNHLLAHSVSTTGEKGVRKMSKTIRVSFLMDEKRWRCFQKMCKQEGETASARLRTLVREELEVGNKYREKEEKEGGTL